MEWMVLVIPRHANVPAWRTNDERGAAACRLGAGGAGASVVMPPPQRCAR